MFGTAGGQRRPMEGIDHGPIAGLKGQMVAAGQSAQQAILATQKLYAFSTMLARVMADA